MKKKDQYTPGIDRAAEEALREEANKPAPLYDKTDRNFQRDYQGQQQGNSKDITTSQQDAKGSGSGEERDII